MTRTYVFVDVETTGFDPQREAIIEVAALAWRSGEIVDSYTSLINPERDIPFEITQLTGIDSALVEEAPRMFSARSRIRRVLGDHIIVGHNVDFDLGFLRAEQLGYGQHRIDTITLASVLLPRMGRYDLSHLVRQLKLPETTAHRAEADARNTLNLFVALWEHALNIDLVLLEEIVMAGEKLGWPETLFFQEVYQQRVQQAFVDDARRGTRSGHLFNPPAVEGQPLHPPEEEQQLTTLDVQVVSGMLHDGSNFSRIFPDYEPRKQQMQMTQAVAHAFNKQQHLLVEAGTGTGKSLAYLLPAAFWATQNERRVVISTNTINLQDQLVMKDIPALQAALPFTLRVAVRKGKSNYLCARLFRQMRHRGPRDKEEMTLFARVLLWLGTTVAGDINEIALRTQGERMAWQRISGENAPCTLQECSAEKCPLHFARRRAEVAHIVIVNHALLLSDIANQNHILPEFRDLIIDEAHHLESAVTSGLSFSADQKYLESLIDEITNTQSGLISMLQKQLRTLPQALADQMDGMLDPLRAHAGIAETRVQEFFEALRFFINDLVYRNSDFSQAVRLVPTVRSQPDYQHVLLNWDNLSKPLGQLAKGIGKVALAVGEILANDMDLEDGGELQAAFASVATSLEDVRTEIQTIIAEPNDDYIMWIEVWRDRIALHAAPLHVGPLVEEHIFGKLDTVIMTSATLRTAPQGRYDKANFDYIRTRLSAHDVSELAVGSPFDYKRATLLYLCSDIPEPKQPGYQRYVENAIVDVAAALGGRTLVLFTSFKQLRDTNGAIQQRLADHDVQVLAQLPGSSRQILTEQFKAPHARAVLLGTRSFWEGFDVPGMALEAVIIVRLPFDVPSDPVVGARSETFDNPFFDYSIPEAVLRFRQGFGRLNRRKSDEGIVVVLDKRVLSKRYGELFLNALPDCVVLRQRTERLPEIIHRWQNRER